MASSSTAVLLESLLLSAVTGKRLVECAVVRFVAEQARCSEPQTASLACFLMQKFWIERISESAITTDKCSAKKLGNQLAFLLFMATVTHHHLICSELEAQ